MKKKIAYLICLVLFVVSFCGCGNKNIAPEESPNENINEETASTSQVEDEPVIVEAQEDEDVSASDFSLFAGNYSFCSGAGGWSTDITLYEDGTFTGLFHDSDMGDIGDDYPNGIVYVCEFEGKFTELIKKDDYTYTCSLDSITQKQPAGGEEIGKEDGIKYIYSDPYGFDSAKDYEFYLPGKNVSELDPEFLSWVSLRYNQPYPDTLFFKAFYNISGQQGFEEATGYSEDEIANVPDSLPIETYQLAGSYKNDNLGITMNISTYTDYIEGDEACGSISWDIPDDSFIWNDEATFLPGTNGFDVKPGFYGEYKIIVTDNTDGKIVIHLYDSKGFDCGEYVMTSHFES